MDNPVKYGFRWNRGINNRAIPTPVERFVENAQSFDVNGGAQNIRLRAGDLVRSEASGGIFLCDGTEGAGGALAPFGVVVGFKPYFDGEQMRYADSLPSDTTYGTNLDRQTKVLVVPFAPGQYWEVDVDEAVTATTLAAYQLLVGANASFVNTGASGELYANPKLDIATAATTSTLAFRIEEVSRNMENFDFSGANVKLIVSPNYVQRPWAAATGPVWGSDGI